MIRFRLSCLILVSCSTNPYTVRTNNSRGIWTRYSWIMAHQLSENARPKHGADKEGVNNRLGLAWRQIKEAVYIQCQRPSLNRGKGHFPPHVYEHMLAHHQSSIFGSHDDTDESSISQNAKLLCPEPMGHFMHLDNGLFFCWGHLSCHNHILNEILLS